MCVWIQNIRQIFFKKWYVDLVSYSQIRIKLRSINQSRISHSVKKIARSCKLRLSKFNRIFFREFWDVGWIFNRLDLEFFIAQFNA